MLSVVVSSPASFAMANIMCRHLVLLECARTEEFFGNLQVARQILRRARKDNPKEWKLWLESALLEIRDGEKEAALLTLQEATAQHAGTGRLWALLIQCAADQEKIKTFKRALEEVTDMFFHLQNIANSC